MGAIFADTNVYMLHMMYQAMGVCLYLQDWDGAMKYGEKIIKPYRYSSTDWNGTLDLDIGLCLHCADCRLIDFFFFLFLALLQRALPSLFFEHSLNVPEAG